MRVLLLDDSLTGWAGHNAGYDFALQDELERRNIPCLIFGNVRATEIQADRPDRIRLVFHHYADLVQQEYSRLPLPGRIRGLAYLIIANWNQWVDLWRGVTSEVQEGDLVVATMALPFTSFALAVWLLLIGGQGKAVTFLSIFHYPPTKFAHSEAKWLKRLGQRHKLVWAAHTKEIADQAAQITESQVVVLPLPFANRSAQAGEEGNRVESADITITYLGLAVFQKGFDLVVAMAETWSQVHGIARCRLVVQFNSLNNDAQSLQWGQTLDRLAGVNPDLVIVHGALSESDYIAQIGAASLILVPNRADAYATALSGIYTEAVGAGKPVVVAAGTIMAQQLMEGAGSGVVFESGDIRSLLNAVQLAVDELPILTEKATAYAAIWRSIHSSARFVDLMLGTL